MDTFLLFNFIFGCILIRLIFVLISYKINKEYLPILGLISIIPAIGFMSIYLGFIKRSSGAFGQEIWWSHLRLIHSLLYLSFAYLAINKNKYSYIPLLLDVVIGFLSFIFNHYLR